MVNGSFCNLCALALGWRYISSLHCADELQQERNSCPQLRSCFIGSGHVGVSKRFSRSISLAVYCLFRCLKPCIKTIVFLYILFFLSLTLFFNHNYILFHCYLSSSLCNLYIFIRILLLSGTSVKLAFVTVKN